MNSKFKTIVAAVLVAAGTLAAAAPASAQGPRGHVEEPRQGSNWHGGHDRFDRDDRRGRPGWGHPGAHRPGGWGRPGVCEPREAIGKAMARGMHRPGINRVSRHQIVVSGRYRGHYAMLVFDRTSRNCRIVAARGI